MSKTTIKVALTFVAGEATVTPTDLQAALAEFNSDPSRAAGIAKVEELLESVPVDSVNTAESLKFRLGKLCTTPEENSAALKALGVVLGDSTRFKGAKGRPGINKDTKEATGGYKRIA
jgi:hypothetical protein